MNNYDEEIQAKVQKHYDFLKSLGLNVVAIFAQGSMNYGLYIQEGSYKSDVDTKAIILPTLDDLVKGNKMISKKYDFEGEQIDVKDIRVMVDMWEKSNPSYLEILFTKYRVINPSYENFINQILNINNDIVKMNFPQLAKCIRGMSKEKVVALKKPFPSLIDKIERFGYDPKQLHHILRLNKLIKDIFINNIPFGDALEIKEDSTRNWLINIKKGTLSLKEAEKESFDYDKDTEKIKEKVLKEYENFKFDSKADKELKNIVYDCVKFNIIKQVKLEE